MTPISSPISTAISSPCILVCAIDPGTGLCVGCGRSRAEIATWTRLDEAERRRIMRLCAARPRPAAPSDRRA